jgi:transcriptional regulator with XRE-family HTH domain
MASGDTPAVARRRLRLALRKAREAKGLTQGQVAEALNWSLSKVNRIELGEVTVSRTDAEALLRLLSVTNDDDHFKLLLEDARLSRGRGWWTEPRYRDHLTSALAEYLQFEEAAVEIRLFSPSLIPGILQTQAYAEALLNLWRDFTEYERQARVEMRMGRRARVVDRTPPVLFHMVLEETTLMREVGGRAVMADQLDEVHAFARRPEVQLRVLPLERSARSTLLGHFIILDLADDQNACLYREGSNSDRFTGEGEEIGKHRDEFEWMWTESYGADDSANLIYARAAAMRSPHLIERLGSVDRIG